MNQFDKILSNYKRVYEHNCFIYKEGDSIKNKLFKIDGYGIYLIYGGQFPVNPKASCNKIKDKSKEIIYIGAGGSIKQTGKMKGQAIKGRLKNTRKGRSADKYYHFLLKKYKYLIFYYFITFNRERNQKVLPKFAEAELMQCYFDSYGVLPKENNSF